ncbi:MAG: GWxTD domain-containing protein [Cryomorphaceae bacterium]|nr:GWxTD domain-containing protein [Cryomorphaceae bacterium]
MRRTYFSFVAIFLIFLAFSCKTPQRGMLGINVAYLYQVEGQVLRADFTLQRVSDDTAYLYYSFLSDDLLFMRKQNSNKLRASVEFRYGLMASIEDREFLDTGRVRLENIVQRGERIIGKFPVFVGNLPKGNDNGILSIHAKDINRNFSMVSFVKIQNIHEGQAQNWRAYRKDRIFLSNFARVEDTLKFAHRYYKSGRFQVDYFRGPYGLALPPFSMREPSERGAMMPDSSFVIEPMQEVVFNKTGVYHIRRSGETRPFGKTIYVMDGNYPLVTQKDELVGPMRYITTKKEYGQLIATDDIDEIKRAVDRFWLERTGSVEKARNLISAYYGRVEKSNLLFSSYKEGWKTDRGLIFTIFGPPNVVTPTEDGERWVYGEENAHLSYIFNFVRIENPFSDNDYELIRDENYRYGWGLAIEAWRLGKVYNVKDIKREQDERDQEIRLRQQPYFWY